MSFEILGFSQIFSAQSDYLSYRYMLLLALLMNTNDIFKWSKEIVKNNPRNKCGLYGVCFQLFGGEGCKGKFWKKTFRASRI
jgi:hypothetical protein